MILSSLLLLLATFIPLVTPSPNCHPIRSRTTPLPLATHCRDLIHALRQVSRLPPYSTSKTWARGLPETPTTGYLPKLYWLPGRGPQTCAVSLDADPRFPDAREMFSLADVAFAASEIVVLCLERKRQVGTAALGPTGRVLAKLVRTDGPAVLRDLGDGDGDGDAEVGWIGVPGGGRLMWSNERGNNGSLLETE